MEVVNHLNGVTSASSPLVYSDRRFTPGIPMHTIDVILPVYNEAWLIGSVLTRIVEFSREQPTYCFLLVDDGSDDETPGLIEKRLERLDHDRIRLLKHEKNAGKAAAIITGLEHGTSDLVCYTDGDLAYSLDHIPRLVDALATVDVVIGSRALCEDTQRNISLKRRIFGEWFNRLVRMVLSLPYRDTQAGLKGFRRPVAVTLFGRLRTRNFAFDAELLFLARQEGFQVEEIPATVSTRHSYKVSTMNMLRDPITMLWSIMKVRLTHRRSRKVRANMIVETKATPEAAAPEPMASVSSMERPEEEVVS